MTQTHLVTRGQGTQQVQASSADEALTIARQYLGAGDWTYVGLVEPEKPWTPPTYQGISRDPLDTEE